jgi:hypothetical protein
VSARWWGSPIFVAPTVANGGVGYLRPSGVEVLSGSAEGGGLAEAPYPYDPDPTKRGALLRSGVTVGAPGLPAEVGLDFDVTLALAYGSYSAHVAQVLVISRGAAVGLADGSGFTATSGHPHGDGLAGPFHSLFALRWGFDWTNQLRLVSEGGVIVCALAAVRYQ